jgi:hypothetical protein
MFHIVKNLLADRDGGTLALLSDLVHENAEFVDRFTEELSGELGRAIEGREENAVAGATRNVLQRMRRQPVFSASLHNVMCGLLELAFDPFTAESSRPGEDQAWANELPEGILWLVAQRAVETGRVPVGLAGHPLFDDAPNENTFPLLMESVFGFLPSDPDPVRQQSWMADLGLVHAALQAVQEGKPRLALFRAMADAGFIPGKAWQTLDPPELAKSCLGEWKKLVAATLNLAWRKPEEAATIEGLDMEAAAAGRPSWMEVPLPEEGPGVFSKPVPLTPAYHFARQGYPIDLSALCESTAEKVFSVGILSGAYTATVGDMPRLARASKLGYLPLFHALAFPSDPESDGRVGLPVAPACEALRKFRLQYAIQPLNTNWGIRNWDLLGDLLDRPALLGSRVRIDASLAPEKEPLVAEVIVAATVRSKGAPSAETEKICRMVLARPGSWGVFSRSVMRSEFGSVEADKLFRGRGYPLPLALFLNMVQPDRQVPPDVARGLLEAGMRAWPGDPLQLANYLTCKESWNETVSITWYDLSDEEVVGLARREVSRRSLALSETEEPQPLL